MKKIIAGLVAVFLVVLMMRGCSGSDASVAQLLPADTIAYLDIPNPSLLYEWLQERDLIDLWRGSMDAEERISLDQLLGFIRQLESSHISMHGFVGETPVILWSGTTQMESPVRELARIIDLSLTPETPILGREISRMEVERNFFLWLLEDENRIFISTDRALLEKVMRNNDSKTREATLAQNEAYQKLLKGYHSDWPTLLMNPNAAMDLVQRMDELPQDVRVSMNAGGLPEVQMLMMNIDLERAVARLRMLPEEDSPMLAVLSKRRASRSLAAFSPTGAMMFAEARPRRGAEVYPLLREQILTTLANTGTTTRNELEAQLKQFEEELGVSLEESADAMRAGIGLVVTQGGGAAIIPFRDEDIIEKWSNHLMSSDRQEETTVQGVRIRHTRWDALAQIDSTLVYGSKSVVFDVVNAYKGGETLAQQDRYRNLERQTAKDAMIRYYLHADPSWPVVGGASAMISASADGNFIEITLETDLDISTSLGQRVKAAF
jgi:hypothetical protein